MLLVADVHGAAAALREVAAVGEPLLVLGDLINFIDYRDNSGILADVIGRPLVDEMVRLRTAGDHDGASAVWRRHMDGREEDVRRLLALRISAEYDAIAEALHGAEAYVTYGNVDRPDLLRDKLPDGVRFVDGDVIDIDGYRVGVAGGGMPALGTPGEVSEPEMAHKLEAIGPVDILCTHVPPAVAALSDDVVGGRSKGFVAILDYVRRHQPAYHYFGDVHQPQAVSWRIGRTLCRNVGYFRATGRPLRHGSV
jgi:Icc-related predicted phosphoesterase